jgi:RNA polymerase sigma-70 factor (ECF subfamily)
MSADPPPRPSTLQLARDGKEEAWNRLVHVYGGLIAYWCRDWRLDEADVDDVCQEVWIRVRGRLAEFESGQPRANFRAWLRQFTINRLRDLRLDRRRMATEPLADEIADQRASAGEEPPEQTRAVYQRALHLMRTEFSEIAINRVIAVVMHDVPVADVAREHGVSEVTVRWDLHRVLTRLREEFGDADSLFG